MKYSVREKIDQSADKELAAYPEALRHLLFHRGQTTAANAERFLNPDYDLHVHDPSLMKDMDKAADRVIKAIKNREKIAVFSDYDADGIPAAVILHDFFMKAGHGSELLEIYIPDRHNEGFGLNMKAVEQFAANGVTLLITADCGIANVKEVARAVKLGIDVIITDHHLPHSSGVPQAFAILDSKQPGCDYPFNMLCGSGVAFKLVQGILKKERFGLKEGAEKWLLDMVGIATLADMVPLRDENRVFAHYGMKVLHKSPRPGLAKLLALSNIDQRTLNEDDVGFSIVPKINVASRLGSSFDAFKLLSAKDEAEAGALAEALGRLNDERKGIVGAMTRQMKKMINERGLNRVDGSEKPVIVLGNPEWRPSLLGLAANSLVDAYHRPVFLWGREGSGALKGSARSAKVPLTKIFEAASRDIMPEYGGHAHAGGFVVHPTSAHLLEDELCRAFDEVFAGAAAADEEISYADAKLSVDEVDWKLYELLEKLGPFGFENERPVFLFEKVPIAAVKLFGKEKNHLELSFERKSSTTLRAISFFKNLESYGAPLSAGSRINLVATLEKSVFGRTPELRLRIVDVF
jgi:single-stranded-DNA-specific exonuclease